jgi:alpha-D-ribose 1-methylphosphonate 5-triphosphate diphosphatase
MAEAGPGFVDLHSDSIESQISPRPQVAFPEEVAFLEMDRYFASSGITSGFHAIPFLEEPGRSVDLGKSLYELIVRYRGEGRMHHGMHLRCELPQEDSVETVADLLMRREAGVVTLMDHTPGRGKYRDPRWFRRLYMKTHPRADEAEIAAAFDKATQSGGSIDLDRADRVARAAKDAGAVLCSHDDDTPETVEILGHGAG